MHAALLASCTHRTCTAMSQARAGTCRALCSVTPTQAKQPLQVLLHRPQLREPRCRPLLRQQRPHRAAIRHETQCIRCQLCCMPREERPACTVGARAGAATACSLAPTRPPLQLLCHGAMWGPGWGGRGSGPSSCAWPRPRPWPCTLTPWALAQRRWRSCCSSSWRLAHRCTHNRHRPRAALIWPCCLQLRCCLRQWWLLGLLMLL